jgi:YHS domain-containing protein
MAVESWAGELLRKYYENRVRVCIACGTTCRRDSKFRLFAGGVRWHFCSDYCRSSFERNDVTEAQLIYSAASALIDRVGRDSSDPPGHARTVARRPDA